MARTRTSTPRPSAREATATMRIDDIAVHLCYEAAVLSCIATRLEDRDTAPLAIGSVNLDHIHCFSGLGEVLKDGGAPWDTRIVSESRVGTAGVEWALLADGAPVVARARRLTGVSWPRLTGADLLSPILELAVARGCSVGFLGGKSDMHVRLRSELGRRYPGLGRVEFWAPERAEIDERDSACRLAERVREADVDLLIVGLGKPRQELWIDRYGAASGARVLLAFGAAADFLSGTVKRAPKQFQDLGLEWLYRLGTEPRRLAHRYLVDGPSAWMTLRHAYLTSFMLQSMAGTGNVFWQKGNHRPQVSPTATR